MEGTDRHHDERKYLAKDSQSNGTDTSASISALTAPSLFNHYGGPDPQSIVFIESQRMSTDAAIVRGYDFNAAGSIDYNQLFSSMKYTGFQATNLGLAIETINKMIGWRLSDEPLAEGEDPADFPMVDREKVKATIFLGYTSNMISSGIRECIRFLAQHRMIDCIVTSAGGIEEDIMKCIAPHYMGDFHHSGVDLRLRGLNRIGNLIVPNTNYIGFEEFITPLLDSMLDEQSSKNIKWTPSKIIHRLGLEIQNEDSVYYWCSKNNIPVFCPAITDGSLGDMIYFHSQQHKDNHLRIDIVEDINKLNNISLLADKSGMIILGGGTVKHHICNANLMRNGADWSVFINTGVEHDGSDSGASPDEAISWGKIKLNAKPVKVWADASLVFPIIVAQTFAQYHQNSPSFVSAPPQPAPAPTIKDNRSSRNKDKSSQHHDLR